MDLWLSFCDPDVSDDAEETGGDRHWNRRTRAKAREPVLCGIPVDGGTCVLPADHTAWPQDGGCTRHAWEVGTRGRAKR